MNLGKIKQLLILSLEFYFIQGLKIKFQKQFYFFSFEIILGPMAKKFYECVLVLKAFLNEKNYEKI